jgi:two-component system OmpR family sensor kinase
MKRRLFWKILLGFWFTFFVIIQGIWLLFLLLRPAGQQPDFARMARMTVAAASSMIKTEGVAPVQAEIARWPGERKGLRIEPQSGARRADPSPVAETVATAPDGERYHVAYYAPVLLRSWNIFHIPWEVLVVGALGGLAFSSILAWYVTRPIRRIGQGFAKLATGLFDTRLGAAMGRRRDEIADLARDFDNMAARLQGLVSARDRLLADVSHELRTPLARLNLAIDLARQDPLNAEHYLDRIGQESLKLDDMVGELLTLSKLEASADRPEEYFNLAELLHSVVEDARYEAAAKAVKITLASNPDSGQWIVPGNGKLIYRAIENIVRNAVRYSPAGGLVEVVLEARNDDFLVRVRDQGEGVCDLAELFKPFGISADGSGFGLGLAIAQRAVAVNGGTIVARNRQPQGLEMEVHLPAGEPA